MSVHFHEIFSYLSAGGGILIPLAFVCFFMWMEIFERIFFFKKLFATDLAPETVLSIIGKKDADLPEGEGLAARLIRDFRIRESEDPVLNKAILKECAMRIRKDLNKKISTIEILAGAATLFGLLGTVTGMITTFNAMAVSGTGDARGMASGISEALITTQCGLMVAIPGIIMAVYLTRRANNAENRLSQLHAMLSRQMTCK